jgi:GTPase
MLKALLFFAGLFFQCSLSSQGFISVRKKNGRVIKQFTTGSFVTFEKKGKEIMEGLILNIRNDSLWVKSVKAPVLLLSNTTITSDAFNAFGITTLHYKDIRRIKIYSKERFLSSKAEKISWFAGSYL